MKRATQTCQKEQAITTHDFKKKILTSSERFTSVSYGFHLWIGSQSVEITFTLQFFQVQLDWSRRRFSLLRSRRVVTQRCVTTLITAAKETTVVFANRKSGFHFTFASIPVFLSIFKLTVFSMLNKHFFVTCKVKRWGKLKIVVLFFIKLTELKCLHPNVFTSQRCSSSGVGKLSLNSFIRLYTISSWLIVVVFFSKE